MHVVHGEVNQNGSPVRGAVVGATAQRLRSKVLLGEATTDGSGRYRIEYTPPDGSFDLVVRARDAAAVRPAPGADETVDLDLGGVDRSEYARLLDDVAPQLDGAEVTELAGDDFSFLARATGQDATQVGLLAAANRHAAATDLPAELFYGLLRQGLTPDLSTLARQPADNLRAALTAAGDERVIDPPTAEQKTEFATRLRQAEVAAFADSETGYTSPVAEIFALALPDQSVREQVYGMYLDHDGSAPRFWARLRRNGGTAAHADRLRLALRLGAMTGNNVSLVRALLDRFDSGEYTDPRELARLDAKAWAQLADETGGSVSLSATGETSQYGELVASLVAEAYPTAHVASRLAASHPAAEFLTENPDFDLITTPVNSRTVPDEPARAELAGIQRVRKIAPTFDAVQTLRTAGFDSAYAVADVGREEFVRRFSDSLGSDQAASVHARATQLHAAALNLVADVRTAGQINVPWLAGVEALNDHIPDWESLFGSPDYCACSECRSVYSQAAYLVDLFGYLRRLGLPVVPPREGSEGSVSDALFARRPDLWDVDLTCDNTNLGLPYVDLVNELLESAVAPVTAIRPALRQTTGEQAQLRIQPQHVNPGAYETLRKSVYPWDLPFDLWGEQTRDYLDHLGVRRDRLMATLRPAEATSTGVAVEQLGLPPVAGKIIAGERLDPHRTLPEFYGLPADTSGPALVDRLSRVRPLLDAAGMRYAELVAVLDTRFVNPAGRMSIQSLDPENPCDTNQLQVRQLDVPALDRLHRFVRLRRALGWTAPQLDQVLAAGNVSRLDQAGLRSVSATRRLAKRLGLPMDQVLTFYAPLPTHRYQAEPSLYDRLFLDPSVFTPDPGSRNPFELNAERTELKEIGSLTDPTVTAVLLGVLEVTDEELAQLVTGPRSVVPSQLLSLATLSALFRTVTLARALDLTVEDLLRLIELYGNGGPFPLPPDSWSGEPDLSAGTTMRLPAVPVRPLPSGGDEVEVSAGTSTRPPGHPDAPPAPLPPADTLIVSTERFLDAVAAIRSRGFTVAELDAVLTAATPAYDGPLPDDEALGATLGTLRSALQAVYQQTARTTDEKGELTRKDLALLGWDAALVQEAIATLLGTVTYRAPLAALPDGVVLPITLPVRHEAGELLFSGPMTVKQRRELETLSTDAGLRAAVGILFAAPRRFVATRMKCLRVPIYAADFEMKPSDLRLPASLAGKVFYDVSERALRARTYLSDAEFQALEKASSLPGFPAAVADLRHAQEAEPEPDNAFLTGADADAFFDGDRVAPADRFHHVLEKLNPYLRRVLSETTVKQQLGQATGLDAASAEVLLGTWLRSPFRPLALADFLTARFVGSDPAVAMTAAGFPEQFVTLRLVHRVALVLARLDVRADEIPWVVGFAGEAGWLDLNTLPPRPLSGPSPLFDRFVRLLDLARLRDGIPGHARTLQAVLSTARTSTVEDIRAELARQTGWSSDDLDVLTGAGLLDLTTPAKYFGEVGLLQLLAATRMLRRLGVAAVRAAEWPPADLTAAAAQAAWQAAKARHPIADWMTAAVPLQDRLRDRQRSALVSHLVANPLRDGDGAPHWTDVNGLHAHFLLDVEMGSCQQATRIAQAIYSIQLFVQRLQLNLEPVARTDDREVWNQWEWTKSYRLWEANQKVFLYPENYFEPDLRVDKSPFFTELEEELLQREVTPDNVEVAFEHYLEKVDRVSGLRPCGVYTHIDEHNRPTVHVVAHTVSTPREYYYRAWVHKTEWTAWQKIELDIEGDTLIPVVWNRRLYLFWPTYTLSSRARPVTMPQGTQPMPEAPKYYKVQLNWSRYINGRWDGKKITTTAVEIDLVSKDIWRVGRERWQDFSFRPQIDQENNELTIWFIDTSTIQLADNYLFVDTAYFRFCAGVGDVIVDGIKPYWRTYENVLGPVPMSRYHTVSNNEEVENTLTGGGKMQIYDPSSRLNQRHHIPMLKKTPGEQLFRILYPTQHPLGPEHFVAFFSDGRRAYLLDHRESSLAMLRDDRIPSPGGAVNQAAISAGRQLATLPATSAVATQSALGQHVADAELASLVKFAFLRFYHPHLRSFVAELNRRGLDGLFDRELQINPDTHGFEFSSATKGYEPDYGVAQPYPGEPVEFDLHDPYGQYNWELLFHAPLMVAQRLSTNQRFAEAQRWFHYIFDPTDQDPRYGAPQRFWRTKPFFQASGEHYRRERIEAVLRALATGSPEADAAVRRWLARPFQPDVVAQLRTTAYQKAVVMKYLDNLIAWGDQLFRQDTLESINQATQLYLLADELLGRRPDEVTGRADDTPQSYRELSESTRPFADAIAEVENLVPVSRGLDAPTIAPGVNLRWLRYFCLPRNEKLVGYWDTVADRLFKIRNCQNIDGVRRDVALFGAPIDPALLVRATAAGVDLATVLDDISAPLPHYRFAAMVAKAKEFAAEVKSFGAALLAALEKRDTEALARLKSGHEVAVLDAARTVRAQQVRDAKESLATLHRSKATAEQKRVYYAGREFMNDGETSHTSLTKASIALQGVSAGFQISAGVASLFPDAKSGPPPTMGITFGGSNLSSALSNLANALGTTAGALGSAGSLSATMGGYRRREDDWKFQAAQAQGEIDQLDRQIAGAEIRVAVAEQELANHDLQRSQAKETDHFLRDKFTNRELYDWMVGQLSTAYFQAYQLAYDVAKRTERAYRHELGVEDSNFIRFGYWDSLHKGLLAGERLTADLHRMDAAYLEANSREFEITKRVSLAQLDPDALLRLKETGRCFVSLPEAIFDLDAPGHYFRRIRSVTITVPCVAGPYTSVNLTARLLRSSVRVDPRVSEDQTYARGKTDTRFRDYTGQIQSIVTSHGQEDAGLFQVGLDDPRFLPFEGAGAVSDWELSLPARFRQFDYESISDLVLHLRFTARDGGGTLAAEAVADLHDSLNTWVHSGGAKGLYRAFSARREFADQWTRFLTPATAADPAVTFTLSKARFPGVFRDQRITARRPVVVLVFSRELADDTKRFVEVYPDRALQVTLTSPTQQRSTAELAADAALAGQPQCSFRSVSGTVTDQDQAWTITVPRAQVAALPDALLRDGNLNPDAVLDVLLLWQYDVSPTQERNSDD